MSDETDAFGDNTFDLAATGGAPRTRPGKPEEPGSVLGPYTLLEPIGEGGFGTVFLAEQSEPIRRQVALKVIKLGMDTEQVVRRFEAERQALALMDHPAIAQVFDGGATDAGRPYFVMEYVEGVPITEYCDEHNLSLRARLELFQAVCRGVQHAHQKGVIHRDIKPNNVLVKTVDDGPAPKIIDFGIAKATDQRLTERTLATDFAQIIGTPEYMAPEQADMMALDIDTRADVYSLGVVLYEIMTGSKPFELSSVAQGGYQKLLHEICEVDPPKPSTRVSTMGGELAEIAARRADSPQGLRRTFRGDLDWIVLRALAKERERRYASASELADDVGRYLDDEPVHATPPSNLYRFRKFARRNRALLVASVVVVAALLGSLAALGWGLVQVRAERDAAETARANESVAREQAQESFRDAERARLLESEARVAAEAALLETQEARALERTAREAEAGARERAESSLAEAEAVTDFLTEMLASVDPGLEGRDVTVRQILDRASQDVASFAGRPNIEQRLRGTIGRAYVDLGLYGEAEQHALAAHAIALREFGADDRRTLKAEVHLGSLRSDQGRYAEAEQVLTSVLKRMEAALGSESAEYARALSLLAYHYSLQGRAAEAEEYFDRAVPRLIELYGREHEAVLASLTNLEAFLWNEDRTEEALAVSDELIETRMRVLGPEHPDTLFTRSNRANQLRAQHRYREAEAEMRAVLAAREEALGADHPHTLESQGRLGSLMSELGRFEEARPLLEQAVEGRIRVLGRDHPETAGSLRKLGLLLWQSGRTAEAEAPLVEAVDAQTRVLGAEHGETLDTRNVLTIVKFELGRLEEARAEWAALVEVAREVHGPEHPNTVLPQTNLAMVLVSLGEYDEAEPLYIEALEVMRRSHGPDANEVQDVMNNIGNLYYYTGRYEEAAALHAEVVDIRKRVRGGQHPLTLGSVNNLALCEMAMGNHDVAEELFYEVLGGYRRALGPDHPDLGQALRNLGAIAMERGNSSEAEELIRDALELYTNAFGEQHESVFNCLHDLAVTLKYQERNEEALELLTRSVAGYEDVLGLAHPSTLQSLRLFAEALVATRGAEAARETVVEIIRRASESARESSATPLALDWLASLLLTCVPEDLRDPARALELAQRANAVTRDATPRYLATLSSARLATGDAQGAISAARQALELLPARSPDRADIEAILEEAQALASPGPDEPF